MLEGRVDPRLSLSSLLSHGVQASQVMKAISKDMHLALTPNSTVITDKKGFRLTWPLLLVIKSNPHHSVEVCMCRERKCSYVQHFSS